MLMLCADADERSASMNLSAECILWLMSQRVAAWIRFPCFLKCAEISEKARSIMVVTVGHFEIRSAHFANFGKLFP